MHYTIECVGTNAGWRYAVTLWVGRVRYDGTRYYKRHEDAQRAANATGAEFRAPKRAVSDDET